MTILYNGGLAVEDVARFDMTIDEYVGGGKKQAKNKVCLGCVQLMLLPLVV